MFKKLALGFSMLVAVISFINPVKAEACGRRNYSSHYDRRPSYVNNNRYYGNARPVSYGGGYRIYRGRYW